MVKILESGSRMTEVSEILRLSPENGRVLDKLVGHPHTRCLWVNAIICGTKTNSTTFITKV